MLNLNQKYDLNLIIPCGGIGKRFIDAGYKISKPFLPLSNSTLLESVILNFHTHFDNYSHYKINIVLVFKRDYYEIHKKNINDIINNLCYYDITIKLIDETEGQLCSVLATEDVLAKNRGIFIYNNDQLVEDSEWSWNFYHFLRSKEAGGAILTFVPEPNNKWSYIKFKKENVLEVREKEIISDIATVGCYYFKDWNTLYTNAKSMIDKNIRVNNEFYVAPVFNEMIKNGDRVVHYLINEMVPLGTPEDYEKAFKSYLR